MTTLQAGLTGLHNLRFGGSILKAMETLALWRERAVQRRQLSALDAHQLKDIGIDRGRANFEAAKPFWRA